MKAATADSRPNAAADAATFSANDTAERATWWHRHDTAIVVVACTLWSWILTWPLISELDRAVYGGPGDATGTIAIYEWFAYAIRHHASLLNNTMWGVPFGSGWQEIPFPPIQLLLFAPMSAVLGGTVAYNVEVLSSYPLTAWAAYLLARQLGWRRLAAGFSAFALTFIPYHLGKSEGHAAQAHLELLVLPVYFLLRWRNGGSRWNVVAAGAIEGIALLSDIYFAFIGAWVIGCVLLASALWPRAKPLYRSLLDHLVAGALAGIVAVPFAALTLLVALRGVLRGRDYASTLGAGLVHRSTFDVTVYTARTQEYFWPFVYNPLVPQWIKTYEVNHLHLSNFTENRLTLGYTVIALAVVGLFARRRRFEAWLCVGLGLVGYLIAEPPVFHRLGPLLIPNPSGVLNGFFPFFRVYARFATMVMIAATMLAGVGFMVLQSRLGSKHQAWLALPFALVALEFNNLPPTHVVTIYPAPAEYRWLATQPAGILVEYPLKAPNAQIQEVQTRRYQLYQHIHGHPILNGASPGSAADSASDALEPYYGTGVTDRLEKLGIQYAFIHRAWYAAYGYLLPTDTQRLRYVLTLDDTDIYRLE